MTSTADYDFEVAIKDSPLDQYLAFHQYAVEKYGSNILVIAQYGDFYEMYGNEARGGANLETISRALEYDVSKKYQRVGFNKTMLDVCVQILFKHYSPIIRVDEVASEGKGSRVRKIRRITRVYTEETYTDSAPYMGGKAESKLANHARKNRKGDSLSLISHIYVRMIPSANNGVIIAVASISIEDGSSNVYQLDSKDSIFDDLASHLIRHRPVLVLFHIRSSSGNKESEKDLATVQKQLRASIPDGTKIEEKKEYSFHYFKLDYQLQFLEKIYGPTSETLSMSERLGLERKPEAMVAFVLLLQDVYEKYPRLLQQLAMPKVLENERYVTISVDGISQLSLYNDINKERSVFDVINQTKTPMGSRLLLSRLLYPVVDTRELERRYEWIEAFIGQETGAEAPWQQLEQLLDGFVDLDKYHRKFTLGTITPANVVLLMQNYDQVREVYRLCRGKDIFPPEFKTMFRSFINAISVIKRTADNYSLRVDYTVENIFVSGHDRKLDLLDAEISAITSTHQAIIECLADRIKPKDSKKGPVAAADLITMKIDIADHICHLEMTPTRLKKLRDSLREEELVVSAPSAPFGAKGIVYSFDSSSFTNRGTKKTKKGISTDQLDELGTRYINAVRKLTKRLKKLYKRFVDTITTEHGEFMRTISHCIAESDFFMALAKIATTNNYCRPQLLSSSDDDFSYLAVSKLRHPIIERELSHVYVPHSLVLGKEGSDSEVSDETVASGNIILLYGSNECGKSTLLRAVGTAVVLAQMGSYVPAEKFELRPFKAIYTRILSKDNIHRSHSSFKVETLEIVPTLTRANEYSLFLADEPCHSTNHEQQIDLVAAYIQKWTQLRCACLITTHVYELADLKEVINAPGLNIYHLTVDLKGTKVMYRRRLCAGIGPDSTRYTAFYVAQAAGVPADVIEMAERIKGKRQKRAEQLLSFKRSGYSSKKYMDVMCEQCGKRKATETHHILPQKDADERGYVGHVPIHSVGNLMRLCEKCHKKITADSRQKDGS